MAAPRLEYQLVRPRSAAMMGYFAGDAVQQALRHRLSKSDQTLIARTSALRTEAGAPTAETSPPITYAVCWYVGTPAVDGAAKFSEKLLFDDPACRCAE